MNYPWLDEYIINKKGCIKDYKAEWNAKLYMLNGKMFALIGKNKAGLAIINIKLEPSNGAELRMRYKDVTPGYHMNKLHWNSIDLDGNIPDQLFKDMIDESYDIIMHSLSKTIREELLK